MATCGICAYFLLFDRASRFIHKEGTYAMKSLDAYNYFISGHVQEVKIWKVDETSSILMASVNASQSSSDKAHR